MNCNELVKEVEKMIKKAGDSQDSNDALKFSQAACNAANAVSSIIMVSGEAEHMPYRNVNYFK